MKTASFSISALIFMMLFVPTVYAQYKIALILLVILSIIINLNKNTSWDTTTVYACGIVAIFGLLNSVHGYVNNTPGALRVLTVMFLWPLLYGFFSISANKPYAISGLDRLFWIVLFSITVYSFLYLGHASGIVPDFLYIEIDQGQDVGFYDGTIEYNMYSISSLLFLVPFAFHRAVFLYRKNALHIRLIILLSAVVILVVLTGRRAVQLLLIITPIIISASVFFFGIKFKTSKKRSRKLLLALSIFGCVAVVFFLREMLLDIENLWLYFIDGFDFRDGNSTVERTDQYYSLIDGWLNGNIFFGAGNGAATALVRSYKQAWAYELTYIYLLFSNGIFGVLFYFGWFSWGLLRVKKKLQKNPAIIPYVTPMITGVFGLVIGAATNPYFAKFDYLWIIMLPHLIAGGLKYQRIDQ